MPSTVATVSVVAGTSHYVIAPKVSARPLGPLEAPDGLAVAEGDRVVIASLEGGGWVIVCRLPPPA